MALRPLFDRVLVKRRDGDTRSPAGLIIPEGARETPSEADVLAVGTGRVLENGSVRPLTVRVGDEDCLILREDEILGVLG